MFETQHALQGARKAQQRGAQPETGEDKNKHLGEELLTDADWGRCAVHQRC